MPQLRPEQWKEVIPYLDQALSLPEEERPAWLTSFREKNPPLADLLQTLLDEHSTLAQQKFLEQSPVLGSQLGPYQIEALLGAGGMGEVYRARDTRLDRTVAIKVLPLRFSSNPERRQRFEREARAISALQHTNICTLYDIGRHNNIDYLVMEYLEGETLREWIEQMEKETAPERLAKLLDLAVQISRGLEAAHQKGIIHRDIKPANIFVTKGGEAKILDFGVAKSLEGREEAAERADAASGTGSATNVAMTRTGAAVGTPLYLSPEQIRAEKLDARTDLFSFGLVLYEMATGERAFGGDTTDALREAVLKAQARPIRELNPQVPAELERVVGKALEKDRDRRYQSAADLRTDLKRVTGEVLPGRAAVVSSATRLAAQGSRSSRRWMIVAAAVVLLAAEIVGKSYFRPRPAFTLTPKDTILLANFDNKTGDPVFDDTLIQGLTVGLEQSPYLNLVSDQKVRETLHMMGQEPGRRVTAEIARDVCQRVNAVAMLEGSITSLGSEYVLGLKATNCATGDLLGVEQLRVQGKERVLSALDKAAISMRSKLGESLSSTSRYSTPIMQATTPSLAALQAWNAGLKAHYDNGDEAAIQYYKRAIELDPKFALAYASLAQCYANLGVAKAAEEDGEKAYQLSNQVSERERFYIESRYHLIRGDLEKMIQVKEQWHQLYRQDVSPSEDLVLDYKMVGRYEDSLRQVREVARLEPNKPDVQLSLAGATLLVGRLDEAQTILNNAHFSAKNADVGAWDTAYYLAFLRGDTVEMGKMLSASPTDHALAHNLHTSAYTEAYYGRIQRARELDQRAFKILTSWSDRPSAEAWTASYQLENALLDVEFGYADRGRKAAAGLLAKSKDPGNEDPTGVAALARTGDRQRTTMWAGLLAKRFPNDTLLKKYWLPTVRAASFLEDHKPAEAVRELEVASSVELGSVLWYYAAPLYPVYLRGQAFLAMNKGREAAVEFQKFADHPGVVANYPLGALARLGLARAYAMQNDTAKARTAYKDFLTLWKDADPDIPILKEAKVEYAKLQ